MEVLSLGLEHKMSSTSNVFEHLTDGGAVCKGYRTFGRWGLAGRSVSWGVGRQDLAGENVSWGGVREARPGWRECISASRLSGFTASLYFPPPARSFLYMDNK